MKMTMVPDRNRSLFQRKNKKRQTSQKLRYLVPKIEAQNDGKMIH
jgi:hypothetical protein